MQSLCKNTLKVRGIVGLQHSGVARQIKIPQAGNPKTQCRSAQHGIEQGAFAGVQWPHRLISPKQGIQPFWVHFTGLQFNAPIVDADR
jgi:hypothetical protein